jgi:hypothetical protein
VSRLELGPLVVMVPEHAGREVDATDFSGETHVAQEFPAAVAGPGNVLIELAYRRWDEAGHVVTLSRGDSPPAYDRLVSGVRMGVQDLGDGRDFCELDKLSWDRQKAWGTMKSAQQIDFDRMLRESAEVVLVEAGAFNFGSREQVLGDESRRRNRLCTTFPAYDPVAPLVAYALTRILPIFAAEGKHDHETASRDRGANQGLGRADHRLRRDDSEGLGLGVGKQI